MSIGIDIGSTSVKIAQTQKEANKPVLKSAGVVAHNIPTPEHITDDKDFAMLSNVIKKLHSSAKITSKDVNIALPESQVFVQNVRFPYLTDQEVASAVKWEAEQYIPIPVKEAIIQHQILERNEQSIPPEVKVLLIGAPKLLIEKYIKVVQGAGLNVVAVETELISLVRSFVPNKSVGVYIDFGARSTDLAIAKSGQLYFSRSISSGGIAITKAISQTLRVSMQQAEEYKKVYGLNKTKLEGKVRSAILPVFNTILDEIKKALHFYVTEYSGESPRSVFLSGGTSYLPEIVTELTNGLGVEVVLANPLSTLSATQAMTSALSNTSALYSISLGLATREV